VGEELNDPEPTPQEVVELAEMVRRLMEGLSEMDRQVLELRLQGCTVPEISDRIDRTEFVIEGRLKKIRRRARDWLPLDERPAGEP
jgi:DNA-directed RNA polymerase specialized sigma24 family protein